MNPFFLTHGDVAYEVPGRAYARFEQSEPPDPEEAEEALFVFSAVDADWLDTRDHPLFDLDPRGPAPQMWQAYWRGAFRGEPPLAWLAPWQEPFESMPLRRYELSLRRGDRAYGELVARSRDEKAWTLLRHDPASNVEADVFGNLFQVAPQTVPVSLESVPHDEASVLSTIFDMDTWPDASEDDIEAALATSQESVMLAVLDVGQGSATALLDDARLPWLYHDLGAGVTRNARTTPTPLTFCWSQGPAVVLSHWDSDHWAGARHDTRALARTWIAPRQSIGTTHTAFANDILKAGGTLHIWPAGQANITVATGGGQQLTVGRCTGNDRNGSCLAMRVDNPLDGATLHWLLTGDAGYHQLPFTLPGETVACVVPHHGAKMSGTGSAPTRGLGYARALFSFGPDNRHGRTAVRHPTDHAVTAHEARGWQSGTWHGVTSPGDTVAGADFLATAEHPAAHLGGCVAGWTAAPIPPTRPCNAGHCTTDLTQS